MSTVPGSTVDADTLTLTVATCTRNTGAAQGQPTYTTSNSRKLTGWTRVRVTRGIERVPSDFDVEFTEPYPGRSDLIVQAGDQCIVTLGGDVVLTGFVDRYMPSYDEHQHVIRVTGRGAAQDIVDCSAKFQGMQLTGLTVLGVAQNLCAPYGINVAVAPGTDVGPPIPYVIVSAGETGIEIIERLARYRAVLVYDQPDGSLLISALGTQQAASGFVEGVNVQAASVVYAMDARFSDITAVNQALNTLEDTGNVSNIADSETDITMPRFRQHVFVSEQTYGGPDVAKQRAQWEMGRRWGRSFAFRVKTDSWRDSAGKLWTPNTLVPVDLPGLKMRPVTWLIADVTYRRDARGTTAELVIMPPQAFLPEPIVLYPVNPDIANH